MGFGEHGGGLTLGPDAAPTASRWRRVVTWAPWGLAAAIAVAGALTAPGATARPDAAPATPPTPSPDDAAPTAATAPTGATSPAELGTAAIAGDDDVGLPADVLLDVRDAARRVLGVAGLDGATSASGWVLDLAVGPVEPVDTDHAVVVVVATVLEATADGWGAPVRRAAAVPLRRAPVAIAGPAWPVLPPAPDGDVVTAATPVADPGPLDDVLDALHDAGWVVDEVRSVATRGAALLEVDVLATPPGDDAATAHVVWVARDPTGVRVLGARAPADDPGPTGVPATTPSPTSTPHDPQEQP